MAFDTYNSGLQIEDTTVPLAPVEEEEEGSVFEGLAYNMNTSYAAVKNRFGEDTSLQFNEEAAQQTQVDLKDPALQEYLGGLSESVKDRLDYGDIKDWHSLSVKVNRIEKADAGMQYVVSKVGMSGAVALGLPMAILDPYDAAALLPLGKLYKATKAAHSIWKTAAFGAAYGLSSEALYQSEMDIRDPKALLLSATIGTVLTSGAHAFTSGTRNSHKVTTDDTGKEAILSDTQVANTKVEDAEEVLYSNIEDTRGLEEQTKHWTDIVVKQKEQTTTSNVANTAAIKELKTAQRQDVKLREQINTQEQVSSYKKLDTEHKILETDFKNFDSSRATIAKQTKTLISEVASLGKIKEKALKEAETLKGLRKDWSERILEGKPYVAVEKRMQALQRKHTAWNKGQDRKIRDLHKNIKDNEAILKNSSTEKVNLGKKRDSARAGLNTFIKNSPIKNIHKVKEVSPKELKKQLADLDIKGKETIANRALADKNRMKNISKVSLDNLKKVAQGLKANSRSIVKQRTAVETLKKELEDVEALKDSIEAIANEGEGILGKIGGFMPYITPKSIVHSSANAVVRGIGQRLYAPVAVLKDSNGNLIPTRDNAKNFKNTLEAKWTRTMHNTARHYREAIKDGSFKGTEDEYVNTVTVEYIKANSNAKREKDLLGLETSAPKYVNDNTHIKASMDELATYTQEMGINIKQLKMSGLENIDSKSYFTRLWNDNKIAKIGQPKAIEILVSAMAKHPKNVKKSDAKLRAEATHLITSLDRGNYMSQLVKDPDIKSPDSGRLLSRKINVYDDDIIELIGTDFLEVGSAYSYAMSGRMALHKYTGASTTSEINTFINKAITAGATPKEVDSIKALVDTLRGTREIMKNPNSFYGKTVRYLTKGNFMVYAMGFGLTSMVEIGNIVATTGLRPTMGMHFDSIASAKAHMNGGPSTKKWINEWKSIGLIGDAISTRAVQRYDSLDTINSDGIIDSTLDSWNNKLSKYSGLVPLTDALKTLSIGSGYNWLTAMARKGEISTADRSRIYRLGLTDDDLVKLKEVDATHTSYDANGNLEAFNFEEWDTDFGEKIQNALMTHSEATVLHPDGASLPMWMSDPSSPVAKILFQFMRFPIAAYEQLSLRGLTEFDAKQTIGIAANMALFTLLAQIKDIGNEKPRYDLDTDEGASNLMQYIATNNYMTGPVLTMMERAYTLGTGHQPFSTWNQGAASMLGVSGNTIKNGQQAANYLVDGDVQKSIQNMVKLTPLHSMPFIKYKLQPLIEGGFDE